MSGDLGKEVPTLRVALAASEARVILLEKETTVLRASLAEIRAQLDELVSLAATQNQELCDLRTMLRRKMNQRKQGVLPDLEGDIAPPNDGVKTDTNKEPESPANPKPANKPFRKPRPKGAGRKPPPSHLPEIGYQGKVCRCEHCGSNNLLARDKEERVRVDAVETIARLRREVLDVVRCKDCGLTTTAPPPSLPCPRAKFTCGFLAWLVTMKFVLLVPLNRIKKLLSKQGLSIPKSTLVRLIDLASTLAESVDGAHWKALKARPCLQTDATGLKVLVDGSPEAWDAILDVFTRDETTVYQFALTKHGDEIAELLKGFSGVLMCDAESRLNEICRKEGVKRANCNAHPRRAFREAEAQQPVLAKEAGNYLSRMYKVEHQAKGLSGPELLARRHAETRPIVDDFKEWLVQHEKLLLPSDPLGKVVRYYLRHFEDLTRFVDDPNIPIDNNSSERSFQDHARLRLNSLFAGSAEGGRRWAILLGVVTTAQRHGLDVQAYLTWMFERRGTRKREYGLTAAQITPAAYKQMLEEADRRAAA